MEVFFNVLPSVLSGIALSLVAYMASLVKGFREEHHTLLDSQRNQIKNSIVRIANESLGNGCIDKLQLETLCRLNESYVKLGGNSYVKELVEHVTELPLKGTADRTMEKLYERVSNEYSDLTN